MLRAIGRGFSILSRYIGVSPFEKWFNIVHGAKVRVSGIVTGRMRSKFIFAGTMSDSGKPYIITIVGPESSGKTTFADSLSEFLSCPAVPEYARTYLEALPNAYTFDDLEIIARGQQDAFLHHVQEPGSLFEPEAFNSAISQEESPIVKAIENKSVLLFPGRPFGVSARKVMIEDSGLLSIRMWAEIKYGASVDLVEQGLNADQTDMYILCRPVYPWAADPLRESRSLVERVWIYNHFLKYLIRWSQRSTVR